MLKLHNVSAGYGGIDVIHNISLEVTPGQNLSIIGANGSGKSTLLKAMAGLLPYKGEITLNGTSLRKLKRNNIATQIAMLSQISHMYFSYSVYDTVMMGCYAHTKKSLLGTPTSKDIAIVTQCLQTVDMLEAKDHDITKLSGGQLQRVFLARTLAQDPSIILLDEPTNHLDLKYQIELLDYLKTWAVENNRAIVGVLHDINHAMRLSSNVVAMKNGRVVAQGNDIINRRLLQKIYATDVAKHMKQTLEIWENIE